MFWSGQGIINEYGDWILHPLYELDDQPNVFQSGPARVRFIGKIFPNAKAKKTSVEYESYGNWVKPNGDFILNSLVPLPRVFSNGIASCFDPRKPKYINLEGHYISDLEGQKKKFFEDGYSAEITQSNIIVSDAEKQLLFKLGGKFDVIEFSSTDRLFLFGTFLSGILKFGFTDLSGSVLTEPIFHTSRDHSFAMSTFKGQSKLILRKGPRIYGLINRDFETLIPFEYEMLRIINQKYILGRKNGDWYLFDHSGEQITIEVPKYFKEHSIRYEGEFGFVKTKEGNYVIDIDGKEVPFFENYEVENLNYGMITLSDNKQKYGLFDSSCKQLLPLVYDQLHVLSEETVLAKLENSYKAIDLKTMTEYNFPNGIKHYQRKLETFRNSNFIRFVKDDHGMGMINTKGEVIIPFQFRLVTYGGEI